MRELEQEVQEEEEEEWERIKKDGGRKKCVLGRKNTKKTGHLVKWNYISDAHTALTLLSHQHIALAEMVYVHVCVDVSAHVRVGDCRKSLKWGFDLEIFAEIQHLLPLLDTVLNQNCLIYNTIERVRCPRPEKPVQTVQREGKKRN